MLYIFLFLATAFSAMITIGGKLYNAVQPEREGYAFAGWWVSAYNDGEKLAYELTESMAVNGNVTLYRIFLFYLRHRLCIF